MADLTTVAKVKAYLGGEWGSDHDTLLASLISQVSAYVIKKTSNNILTDDYVEYYDGDGTDTLVLRQTPLTALTSIYDDTDYAWGATTEIPLTDVVFACKTSGTNIANRGILKLDGNTFSVGTQNIKVSYTAGYPTTPQDLEQGVIALIGSWFVIGQGSIDAVVEGQDDVPTRLDSKGLNFIDPYISIGA